MRYQWPQKAAPAQLALRKLKRDLARLQKTDDLFHVHTEADIQKLVLRSDLPIALPHRRREPSFKVLRSTLKRPDMTSAIKYWSSTLTA